MKRKMKQWLSMFLVAAMVLTLMPTNIASAEELSEPTEAITEATTEVTTEAEMEVITEVATEEEATEAITEVTTETMEEVSTEETSEESITEEALPTVKADKIAGGYRINGFMAYGNLSETEDYTLKTLTDNVLLKKVMYYSYGCVGYTETIPITYSDNSESTKVSKANAIITNVLNGTSDSVTAKFLNDIKTLPAPSNSEMEPYYVMNASGNKVGVTFTSNQPIPQAIDDGIMIGGEDEELLGTSNGSVAHEPSEGSSGQITNPAAYGLPTRLADIPSNWFSANSSGGWNASSVRLGCYNFTYTSNSNSGRNTTYQPATARITSGELNGLSVYLSTCRTGNTDSAPTSSNASGVGNYGFNAADLKYPYSQTGDCKMNVWVTRVDQTNHRVYLLFFTDYISYDSNRSSTSVQSVGGSMWYTFSSEEYITVTKDDFADYLASMKNADANLSALTTDGITFGIYKSDKATLICKYFIDATGQGLLMNDAGQITPATVKPLTAGEKYYIKELSGNASYKVDSTGGDGNGFYEFTPHNTTSSSPQNIVRVDDIATYVLNLKKVSANPNCTNGNPLYSLAGAEYVLRDKNGTSANFIVGYETNSNYQDVNGKSTNQVLHVPIFRNTGSAKLITDANGNFTYTFTYDGDSSNITNYYQNVKINGNQYTITFTNGIQVVAGTYRLSETKAPSGYDFDPDCQEDIAGKYHEVTLGTSNPTATITCKEPPRLDPLRYSMTKMDSTYGEVASGKGSLDGSIFEVAYYNDYYTKDNLPSSPTAKWYFKTVNGAWDYQFSSLYNGDGYVSSPEYKDDKGNRTIPMGTVTVKEVKAPEGYGLVNEKNMSGKYVIDGKDYNDTGCILYQFRWSDTDGRVLRYLDGGNTPSTGVINEIKTSTYDVVKRGDLAFDKIDYKSGSTMQHIGFIVKSKTTGEQHIIVTNENGHAGTNALPHSSNTNGNDKYLEDLEIDAVLTNQLKPTGIWFYGTADKDKWDASLIDDNAGALPYDDYDIKEIVSNGNAGTQLINWGDYTFSIRNNKEVNAQTIFDMDLPSFETDSADKTLGNNYTVAAKQASIIDTVSYQKLRYDHTYTFKGVMVAREDFELDNGMVYKAGQPILDDNGNLIRSNVTFQTSARGNSSYVANASGKVKLEYNFDAETLSGAKGVWKVYLCDGADKDLLVIDEKGNVDRAASKVSNIHLEGGKRYWCEAVDLSNQREWITFPEVNLHTTALSEDTKTHEGRAYKQAKVIDTVEYTNLLPGRTYKLIGTAMDSKSGKAIEIDGKPVEVEKEFTVPNKPLNEFGLVDGYVDVEFNFDATLLADTTMVVFEKLYIESDKEWNYVSGHEDINDEGQSVHYVDVKTTALDQKTGTHETAAVKKVTVVDKVECKNLIIGKQYTVKGMIMVIPDEVIGTADKSGDYELSDYPYTYDEKTNTYVDANGIKCHPFLVDGKPVTSELTFTATEKNCIVNLEFTFDARSLKGKQINVFEDLYNENGIRIGTHADLTDSEQTITVVPKDTDISIHTKTKISGSGGVKTGDIAFLIIFILLLSSIIMAAIVYFHIHKKEKNQLWNKMKKALKPNKIKHLMLIGFVSILAGILLGANIVSAASDKLKVNQDVKVGDKIYDYQLITDYESDNPKQTYDFEKKYDGAKLKDTSYEVIDTIYPEKTVTTKKTYKCKSKDDSISETIKKDGITYQLKDVSWKEVPVTEQVDYTIDYGYQTSKPAYPDTYDYTYESPTTGKEVSVTLPFVRLNKSNPEWVNGFSADVTFKNIDGEEFTLGSHTFDYSDNLTLTESDYQELVKKLGYDTSLYRLNSMNWNGAVYETSDGELWRNAVVTGQQYASRYSAYYADTVQTGTTYEAVATYEAKVADEEATPTYRIRATALYQNTGIWSNIIQFVVNNKTVSGIFVFIILLLLAAAGLLVLRFRKKQPEE